MIRLPVRYFLAAVDAIHNTGAELVVMNEFYGRVMWTAGSQPVTNTLNELEYRLVFRYATNAQGSLNEPILFDVDSLAELAEQLRTIDQRQVIEIDTRNEWWANVSAPGLTQWWEVDCQPDDASYAGLLEHSFEYAILDPKTPSETTFVDCGLLARLPADPASIRHTSTHTIVVAASEKWAAIVMKPDQLTRPRSDALLWLSMSDNPEIEKLQNQS